MERAIDQHNGVRREAGNTNAERAQSFTRAAAGCSVAGYLDDTGLQGPVSGLGVGHQVYHCECLKKNGVTVPKKPVMSGNWYGETPSGEKQTGQGRDAGSQPMTDYLRSTAVRKRMDEDGRARNSRSASYNCW
eukprot:SAG31_NODE_1625_length_7716_cov_23.849941_1_plen_133_part_00